jgi:hypothetical protein
VTGSNASAHHLWVVSINVLPTSILTKTFISFTG